MENLRNDIKELSSSWNNVYKIIGGSPELWEPHIPYANPDSIDEIVTTINKLLGGVNAPKGYAPIFHVAKNLVGNNIALAITASKAIESGTYSQFPTYIARLTAILNAIHTMVIVSQSSDPKTLTAALSVELSESISLLKSTQKELKKKDDQLQAIIETIQKAEEKVESISGFHTTASQKNEEISKYATDADASLKSIGSTHQLIEQNQEETNILLVQNKKLQGDIEAELNTIAELEKKNQEIEKTITALLPKGASAGLAASFAERKDNLNLTKWIWMIIFILDLAVLIYFALQIVDLADSENIDFLTHFFKRLPLATPFIWLGWFSAVQYGNTIRLQEDYAFKEATSKAFAGYRKHMEHLANVDLGEGNKAMELLAAETIRVLANEPLRIFQKSHEEATPAHSLIDSIFRKKIKSKDIL